MGDMEALRFYIAAVLYRDDFHISTREYVTMQKTRPRVWAGLGA
jgi:hypothetical protein